MSERPYVICHMLTSIDGKGAGKFLWAPECEEAVECYYQVNRELKGDAFACGRVTMEESFTHGHIPDLAPFAGAEERRENYIAEGNSHLYAVAFDRRGRLGWEASVIEDDDPGYGGAHIIEVLEDANPRYTAYLRDKGISYVFARTVREALDLLYGLFGIKRLLLEGGPMLNGAFLKEGLIDEVSFVVAPVAAGEEGRDVLNGGGITGFSSCGVERLKGSVLHITYAGKGLDMDS